MDAGLGFDKVSLSPGNSEASDGWEHYPNNRTNSRNINKNEAI